MELFISSVLGKNPQQQQIRDQCNLKQITSIYKLIGLLDQSNFVTEKERNQIALHKHIYVSYSKTDDQSVQILIDLKKLGVISVLMLQEVSDQDLQKCGLQKDYFKQIGFILEQELEMDQADIQNVVSKLYQVQINRSQILQQLTDDQAAGYGIPKYSFRQWKNKFQSSQPFQPLSFINQLQQCNATFKKQNFQTNQNFTQNPNFSFQQNTYVPCVKNITNKNYFTQQVQQQSPNTIIKQNSTQRYQNQQHVFFSDSSKQSFPINRFPNLTTNQQFNQIKYDTIRNTSGHSEQSCIFNSDSTAISNEEEDEKSRIKKELENLARKCKIVKELQEDDQSLKIYLYPEYKASQFNDISEFKTLIVIGETGAGKSTMINFFCNYYLGVQFEYPFRFLIVDETSKNYGNQAISQTKDVKVYYLKGKDGNLAQEQLILQDLEIQGDKNKIKQLLNQLQRSCKSQINVNRLTIPQKYIMDQLLKLFGNDVIENFMFLFTFADFAAPQALNALQFHGDQHHTASPVAKLISQTRDPYWLKFNNSAYQYVGKPNSNKDYWIEAYESFKQFYEQRILKTQFVSLRLTKAVIFERKQIVNLIIHLRPQIQKLLNKVADIDNQVDIIQKLTDFESTNLTITQKKYEILKVDLKPEEFVTNCIKCNFTCQDLCSISIDSEINKCCAMRDGLCTVCEGQCNWQDHKIQSFRFEIKEKNEEVKLEDFIQRHQKTATEKPSKEGLLNILKEDKYKIKKNCENKILNLLNSIHRLNEIALQPAISDAYSDYIVSLIKEEEQLKQPGYENRVEGLKAIKDSQDWLLQQMENQKK